MGRRERLMASLRDEDWSSLLVFVKACTQTVLPAFHIAQWMGGAGRVLSARAEELARVPGLREAGARRLLAAAAAIDGQREVDRLRRLSIQPLRWGSPDYPLYLSEIPDPPLVLFIQGRRDLFDQAGIAVVGARRCSVLGRTLAHEMGRGMAGAGWTVYSGLARGIDAGAHEGALASEAGGTVAVLGCGLDIVYPKTNRRLYDEIQRRGCLVSELPPGTPPLRHHFPSRNRLMSGLSRGVAVIEAARRSGSRLTAEHALRQDRDVFAVPGDVDRVLAEGTNDLIREGAVAVRSSRDVLEHYGECSLDRSAGGVLPSLCPDEFSTLQVLTAEGVHLDQLGEETGRDRVGLIEILTDLVKKGLAVRGPGGRYARTGRAHALVTSPPGQGSLAPADPARRASREDPSDRAEND